MAPRVQPAPRTTPSCGAADSSASILLGKYELGRLLGRGSFAKVYAARSVGDGATVAIKVIDKSTAVPGDAAAYQQRILREVEVMRRLNHPNVLRIHEVMATKSKIYLVMELARGGDICSKIARASGGRLQEPAARRYFQQLVAALHYCHRHGVAHRDVKPQNLLLDEHNNVKLSDFGLSATPEQIKHGMVQTRCGTPAFMAPEIVCLRQGYDGAKADAWSCGVLLFAFLAGALPFDDSNLPAMYRKIRRRELEFPAWISKSSRSIIVKLLDPNPDSRMSIETLMNTSWYKKSLQTSNPHIERAVDYDSGCSIPNAFHIISMSSGLDLSGLFEAANGGGKRFMAAGASETVAERVREEGEKQGYNVRKGKGRNLRMEKGGVLVVAAEMWEVVPSLTVVDVKNTAATVDFGGIEWGELKAGLGDMVLQWHNMDGS